MVDPDSGRIPRVPPYSGTAPSRAECVSRTGLSPSLAARPSAFRYASCPGRSPRRRPTTPDPSPDPVWAPPRSLAATGGISLDFLSCWYLDGSLPSVFLRRAILFTRRRRIFSSGGLPHSGTPGSSDAGSYPGPFAAGRALLRLAAPRHPLMDPSFT